VSYVATKHGTNIGESYANREGAPNLPNCMKKELYLFYAGEFGENCRELQHITNHFLLSFYLVISTGYFTVRFSKICFLFRISIIFMRLQDHHVFNFMFNTN